MGRWYLGAGMVALALLMGGCGDNDDGNDSADDVTESAGARAVAEGLRASLIAQDLERNESERHTAVVVNAVEDLPGEPDVSGIADANGDGLDDDGLVDVHVDRETACVSIGMEGDVDVSGGRC